MNRVLSFAAGLIVMAVSTLGSYTPGQAASQSAIMPAGTVNIAHFFKPPNMDAATAARTFNTIVLTNGDYAYRNQLAANGFSSTIPEYFRADGIQNPGSCTASPSNNQVAYRAGDFCYISANHPDWFLLDASGRRITVTSSGEYYRMDPASPGWRDFFLTRVVESQNEHGWSGLFLDNVEGGLGKFYGSKSVKYPDNASYQNAIAGFLQYLYVNYSQVYGRPIIGNIVARADDAVWFTYLQYMDGAMQERFAVDWDETSYLSADRWQKDLDFFERTQANGKYAILVATGNRNDLQRQNFAFASYLLISNGKAAFRYSTDDAYRDVWLYDNYKVNPGTPRGPRYQVGGLWRRDFTNGCVTVDPVNHSATLEFNGGACMPLSWAGGVVVQSDRRLVAVGRPHVSDQVMTYNGYAGGSQSMYIPMLFKGAFGGSYNSAFYVQNVNDSTANITIKYYDTSGGLNCTVNDTIAPQASKGYWVPSITCLPSGWVGGVVVSSNQNIVAVGRPHIGNEITTYNGFANGGQSMYIPMLFKGAFGGSYNSAFYVQNVSGSTANITIRYYDANGTVNCTVDDTIVPFASKSYWLPNVSCLPSGWVGGVIVSSNQNIVAVGRPHIGNEVTTYNGFASGSQSMHIPMLFKGAFGGSYNSAFYVQNVNGSAANITIRYYDTSGGLSCTMDDTIAPFASKSYWLPGIGCLPSGWVGGVVVSSNQNIVAVGRPHIGDEITTYSGFTNGSSSMHVPMLFKNMWGSYDSAFYLQNMEAGSSANVTLRFYDVSGKLVCTRSDSIPPLASLGYWVPKVTCE